jgi:hypothetical protein
MWDQKLKLENLLFRSWYYFRLGYNTYFSFPIGYVSTLVTVYYLAIRNVPGLQDLVPRFLIFCVLGTALLFPLSVAIGWIHMKRSLALRSELDIQVEANPYNYKLPPGYYKEVLFPTLQEILTGTIQLLDEKGLIDSSRKKHLGELQQKLDALLQGGYVGRPHLKM